MALEKLADVRAVAQGGYPQVSIILYDFSLTAIYS